jgi:hypothetical protein
VDSRSDASPAKRIFAIQGHGLNVHAAIVPVHPAGTKIPKNRLPARFSSQLAAEGFAGQTNGRRLV